MTTQAATVRGSVTVSEREHYLDVAWDIPHQGERKIASSDFWHLFGSHRVAHRTGPCSWSVRTAQREQLQNWCLRWFPPHAIRWLTGCAGCGLVQDSREGWVITITGNSTSGAHEHTLWCPACAQKRGI